MIVHEVRAQRLKDSALLMFMSSPLVSKVNSSGRGWCIAI